MTETDSGELRPARVKPRPVGPQHDRLHMMEGLRDCHCMCARCWLPYQRRGGICICRECPCAAAYQATFPMYVPRSIPPPSQGFA